MLKKYIENKGLAWKCAVANLPILALFLLTIALGLIFSALSILTLIPLILGVLVNIFGIICLIIDLLNLIFFKTEAKIPIINFLLSIPIIFLALAFYYYACPFEANPRYPVARVKGDQRMLTIALETYYIDQRNYPAWSLDRSQKFAGGVKDRKGILTHQPTFRMANGSGLRTLTTPIAYASTYYSDPWSPIKGATFSYWNDSTATTTATGYILWSPGKDGIYDLSIDNIAKAYDPKTSVPSNLLIELTYDPSNGTESRGDIWRVN